MSLKEYYIWQLRERTEIRFEELKKILDGNSSIRVRIAGALFGTQNYGDNTGNNIINSNNFPHAKHFLGITIAKDTWNKIDKTFGNMNIENITRNVQNLFDTYKGRIDFGNVGFHNLCGTGDYAVSKEEQPSASYIHVWGANAGNIKPEHTDPDTNSIDNNTRVGKTRGSNQAKCFDQRKDGVFGIDTMPNDNLNKMPNKNLNTIPDNNLNTIPDNNIKTIPESIDNKFIIDKLEERKSFIIGYYELIHTPSTTESTKNFTKYLKERRTNLLNKIDPTLLGAQYAPHEAISKIFDYWFEKMLDQDDTDDTLSIKFPLGYCRHYHKFIKAEEEDFYAEKNYSLITSLILKIDTNIITENTSFNFTKIEDNIYRFDNELIPRDIHNTESYTKNNITYDFKQDYFIFNNIKMLTVEIKRRQHIELDKYYIDNRNYDIQFILADDLILYSIVCFFSINNHYKCYFKGDDDNWYIYDDINASITEIYNIETNNDIKSNCCYLVYYHKSTITKSTLLPTNFSRYNNDGSSCYYAGLWALLHKSDNPFIEEVKKIIFEEENYLDDNTNKKYLIKNLQDSYFNQKTNTGVKSNSNTNNSNSNTNSNSNNNNSNSNTGVKSNSINSNTKITLLILVSFLAVNYNKLDSFEAEDYIFGLLCLIISQFIVPELDISKQVTNYLEYILKYIFKKITFQIGGEGDMSFQNKIVSSKSRSLLNLFNKLKNKIILILEEWIKIPNRSENDLKKIIEKNKRNLQIQDSNKIKTILPEKFPEKLSIKINNKIISITNKIEKLKKEIDEEYENIIEYTKILSGLKSDKFCENYDLDGLNKDTIHNCVNNYKKLIKDKNKKSKDIKEIFYRLLK